ncbi:MAG TPA: hypothetical protein PK379_00270 [Candidatus Hydrogenedentes bacterium]|nr:hypothetical protein [Candidatus Hydrogenedentota bacterium]HOK88437.1 hypothetical protein [Candidatus Hydrogenedentota bacterium]
MDPKEFARMLIQSLPGDCQVIAREGEFEKVVFTRDGSTFYMQPGTFPGTVEFTMAVTAYEPEDNLWFVLQANFLNYTFGGAKFQVRPVRDEDRLLMLIECCYVVFVQDEERFGETVPLILDRLQQCADTYENILEQMEEVFDSLKGKDQKRFSDDKLLFDIHRWNNKTLEEIAADDDDDDDDYDDDDDDDDYDEYDDDDDDDDYDFEDDDEFHDLDLDEDEDEDEDEDDRRKKGGGKKKRR